MDAFLSEIFDVRGVDHLPFTDPLTGGVSHAALMRDERLVLNAAFRFAWAHLSGGAFPSARCFSDFIRTLPQPSTPTLGHIAGWILTNPDGPFHILKGTSVIRERLASLEDGRFLGYLNSLREPSNKVLHSSIVQKLIDRHSSHPDSHSVQRFIDTSLFSAYRDLTSNAPIADCFHVTTNLASAMVAPVIEARSSLSCNAPLRVGRADAIKRRFSRDLHFQRMQFGKVYLTSPDVLLAHAEVVKIAVDAPWVVKNQHTSLVEQHAPVIASACIRLCLFQSSPCLPPAKVCLGNDVKLPTSFLIVFGAGIDVPDIDIASLGEGLGYHRIFRAFTSDDIDVYVPPKVGHSRLVYPIFFPSEGTHHWSYGVLANILRRHLTTPCPFLSSASCHAQLLVDRCIVRVALARHIFSKAHFSTSLSAQNIILAIDSRADPSPTILSVAIALSSLSDPMDWSVRILCSKRNKYEFERMLLPLCACAQFDASAPELNGPAEAFVVERSYNSLMLNPQTWRSLLPARVVLTVQDDGILFRPGVEKLIRPELVYLGAPWADLPCNAALKLMVPSLIGNGGLSLRNVPAMVEMAESLTETDRNRLYHSCLEAVPEDVVFASLAYKRQSLSPDASSLPNLSCEEVPDNLALGFHKPWPYWSVMQTHSHMEAIVASL